MHPAPTMNATTPRTNDPAPPQPTRKIVYWFLLVLGAVGLLPLGLSAYKLIQTSRESLVTSQQEVQLQVATATARQLQASVDGMRAQMARLAESIASLPRSAGGADLTRVVGERRLMEKFLGTDLLLMRYTARSGTPVEARQSGFPARPEVEAAIKGVQRAALEGEAAVSDPVPMSTPEGLRSVLVVSVPVGSERPAAGALTGVVDFASFWDPVVGGRRAAYLIYALDRKGTLFAAQDEEGILARSDYRKIAQEFRRAGAHSALTSEFTLLVDNKPVEYIASFDTTPQGWGIFVQLEKRQAYASVHQMIQAALLWASVAMGLALVLAYLLANTVTRPIEALAAGTQAFARGELDYRVEVRSRNELGALAGTFNTMARQLQDYIQRLSAAAQLNNELFMGTIKALAEAIDEKDPYTRGHSERVNRYAIILAKQLGLGTKEIREVHISSLFHDIGKIGIEDKILRKPAALTAEEYEVMKQHPEKGAQMLSKIKAMKDIIPGMRFHHERWDGSGYPLRLRGEQIPLAARIVAVADAFDAMTTNRPYQKAMPYDKAIARLYDLADRAFDRKVVAAFAEAYKVGVFKEPRVEVHEEQ
ncbi:MAG TPA: HD domain-containing phosphohydrolase [Candidatus Polarisedimenticolia bacterium]|nr:HD domain-containing phosphohydrolase [Candidatus Polarisedimenticolia bacterium]